MATCDSVLVKSSLLKCQDSFGDVERTVAWRDG